MDGTLGDHPTRFRERARRHVLGVLYERRGDALRLRVAREPPGPQLRARAARRPPYHEAQPPSPPGRLPRRRLDADAAPRPRGRLDALLHLLRVHLAVHRDGRARAEPPAPRQPEVPARRDLPGLRVRGRPRWCLLRRRHPVGARTSLHRAPVPHPDQDQAGRRGDPRHVPRDRCVRIPHRGAAYRAHRPSGLREVVVRRVPDLVVLRLVDDQRAPADAPVHVGRALPGVPGVPDHPAHHQVAPHDHVADEHVPGRPRPAEGRDEAHAEPDGDRPRHLRRIHRRGLHLEAALRHRRVHGVRTMHVGVPREDHGEAARPPRDRAEGRRGDGGHRRPGRVAARRPVAATSRSAPTRCSSASRRRSCGRARRARRATRSAR